jgi:predicted nucleotidyltransferase
LLKKGNATLIEWLDSPLVYRADEAFLAAMRRAAQETWQPERAFRHYIHMARGNNREYLQGETVRFKKYLYVLRPLLACLWIERKGGMPPMPFQALVDGIVEDAALRAAIDDLLARKRTANEAERCAAIPAIRAFIDAELDRLVSYAPPPRAEVDFSRLDTLLRETVLRFDAAA